MSIEPIWLEKTEILAVHSELIVEHGGSDGVRDMGLLESAIARPQNLYSYGSIDVVDLAASLGYGIIRNHPFIDGNKRTGLVAMLLFLDYQGYDTNITDEEAVMFTLDLAAGKKTEAELSAWLRLYIIENGNPLASH